LLRYCQTIAEFGTTYRTSILILPLLQYLSMTVLVIC